MHSSHLETRKENAWVQQYDVLAVIADKCLVLQRVLQDAHMMTEEVLLYLVATNEVSTFHLVPHSTICDTGKLC